MAASPQISLYRRATAAALMVAPLLALADNLLHPKEFARDHEAQQLERIADAYTRWQLLELVPRLNPRPGREAAR